MRWPFKSKKIRSVNFTSENTIRQHFSWFNEDLVWVKEIKPKCIVTERKRGSSNAID